MADKKTLKDALNAAGIKFPNNASLAVLKKIAAKNNIAAAAESGDETKKLSHAESAAAGITRTA